MNHKENDIVLPGEIICTYEEYIPSDYTYVEEGYIKSAIGGRIIINNDEKSISVKSANPPRNLKVNDIVIGYITEVKPNKILVTIKMIKNVERELITAYKGFIHVSKANTSYISVLHDLYKIGDIVEARVLKIIDSEYVELTTNEDSTGVIKAMCTNCRKFMQLHDDKLVCECGLVDVRKISSNYGGY